MTPTSLFDMKYIHFLQILQVMRYYFFRFFPEDRLHIAAYEKRPPQKAASRFDQKQTSRRMDSIRIVVQETGNLVARACFLKLRLALLADIHTLPAAIIEVTTLALLVW